MTFGATWCCSDDKLTLQSTSGTTAVFAANGGVTGLGWVGITINGNVVAKKDVWVGIPQVSLPSYEPITTPKNQPVRCFMNITNEGLANPTSFQWIVNDGYVGFNPSAYSKMVDMTFYTAGYYTTEARAINACGSSNWTSELAITVTNGYYSMAYPNPTSNTLNIEIDKTTYMQAKSLEQTTTIAKQLKIDPTFDIRLYDGQGNIVRRVQNKGGNVQFNISDLLIGIYYLHVYDGISEKPEIQQIAIER